jgi:hypothetical protein
MIQVAIILISVLILSVFCIESTKTLKSINRIDIVNKAMYYKLPVNKKIKYLFKNNRFFKK